MPSFTMLSEVINMASNYLRRWRKVKAIASDMVSDDPIEASGNDEAVGSPNTPLTEDKSPHDDSNTSEDDADELDLDEFQFFDDRSSESEPDLGFHFQNSNVDPLLQDRNLNLNERTLREKMAEWATKNNQTRSSVNELLQILRDENLPLPKDSRTLLQTPREIPIEDKCGGKYAYFGIEAGILKIFKSGSEVPNEINLLTNIDGIPLFKSSCTQFWPIICSFDTYRPFVVALFYGQSKPSNVTDFLYDFLVEYARLKEEGIQVNDALIKINFKAFVCDAPARSFLKSVKGHSGYFSCERCEVKGTYQMGRVVLHENEDFPLRTDAGFADRQYSDHQTAVSPLSEAGFPCVTGFCLDYMHLVCLGVMRRILSFFRQGPATCKLSQVQINLISGELLNMSGRLPTEFSRQPRSLKELDRWKATELRQFLLYTGPLVLKNVLHKNMYSHFLCLSVSISILLDSDKEKREHFLAYSRQLLKYFIDKSSEFYSDSFPVYNIHSLKHLPDDVENFGCSLNDISSFPFENHLQVLKRLVRSSKNPISQVAKRLYELEFAATQNYAAYSCLTHITTSRKNGCILLKNEDFAFVIEKRDDGALICDVLHQRYTDNLFTEPCESKLINIVFVNNPRQMRSQRRLVDPSEVSKKVACLPFKRGLALIPLLHGMEK